MYDLVIFGGGPCGLSLAQMAKRLNKSVLLVEKEDTLGGCHRVDRRVASSDSKRRSYDGVFSEHGPRVYVDNYRTFERLLRDMGTSMDDLFEESVYGNKLRNRGDMTPTSLKWYEQLAIVRVILKHAFLLLFHGRPDAHPFHEISVESFMDDQGFTPESRWYIDSLCRTTDGGGSNTYSLFQFMELLDIGLAKKVMQPRAPADRRHNSDGSGFVERWREHLVSEPRPVDIMTGWSLTGMKTKDGAVQYATVRKKNSDDEKTLRGQAYVLAMPPESILTVFDGIKKAGDVDLDDAFAPPPNHASFRDWSAATRYDEYLCFTLHWLGGGEGAAAKVVRENEKTRTTMTETEWGVGFMLMGFPSVENEHVVARSSASACLSCSITRPRVRSSFTKKTADDCENSDEWAAEATRQILTETGLPAPDLIVPFSAVERTSPRASVGTESSSPRWRNTTTAFFRAANSGVIPFGSAKLRNLYNVGCQNGHQKYHLTTLEAAVSNSIAFMHQVYPASRKLYKIVGPGWRVSHLVYIALIIVLSLTIYAVYAAVK